jgi:acyl-CoA hydrolase
MTFLLPVRISELLTFKARVNAVWRTSLEVGVRVEAENVRTGELRHTNTAFLTMVALDDAGKPAPVPPIVPDGPDALRRQNEAQLRRTHRLAEREAIMRARSEEEAGQG